MEIITNENSDWSRKGNINRIRLMIIDPFTLFAYWEVDTLHQQLISDHFQCRWEELPLLLLLHDVTTVHFNGTNAPIVSQERVNAGSDHWYFRHTSPQHRYVLDLRTTTLSGQHFAILRSNMVVTPPIPGEMPGTPNFEWQEEAYNTLAPTRFSTNNELFTDAVANPLLKIPYHNEFDGYRIIERGLAHE